MISLTNLQRLRLASVGLAAVVAVALLMPSCGSSTAPTSATAPGEEPRTDNIGQLVSIQSLTANPSAYYNRQVATTGVVRQIVAPDAFVLGPTTAAPETESILVAGKNLPALTSGEAVSVVGTPQEFNFTEFNNQIGRNWNEAAFTPYMNKPAIMATEVTSRQNTQTPAGTPGQ